MKRGCKRSGEALSVASGPVFVMEKTHTLPRSLGRWNLDPSRAEAISPKNACGDDANALPISVLACNPPAAMMLIHPSRPASVQKSTLFSERLHHKTATDNSERSALDLFSPSDIYLTSNLGFDSMLRRVAWEDDAHVVRAALWLTSAVL